MPDRRHFLLSALALPFTLRSGPAGGDGARLPDSVCRSIPPAAVPAALPPRQPGVLRYQGTHILTHGAFRDLADAYRGPGGERVWVAGGGCDDGISAVRRGLAELGGMCCPVPGSRGEGLHWLTVALDIKVAITHPSNPVTDIPLEALREVARGRLLRWKALGGEDRPIALVARKHCPDYAEPVRELLVGRQASWTALGLFVDRDEQITDLVARYSGSLGLVSLVFAKPLAEAGRVKILRVDGRKPEAAAVRAGRYPLHGPLSVLYLRWEPEMRPWFDFVYGPEGRAIIGRALVPVSAEEGGYRPLRWT